MDPTTAMLLSSGIGALGGALTGGGDQSLDLKDKWGRELAQPVRDLQKDILDLPAQEFFPGQTYANLRPTQSDAYRAMIGYGQPGGFGANVLGGTTLQGITGLGALGAGTDYVSGLQAPEFQFDQGTFDTVMGNLLPSLPGAYDEATRDITRDLNWNVLPGINTAAAMTGNRASSETSLERGIAKGMAQDRMADVGSQLYQNALNRATQSAYGAGQSNLRSDLGTQGDILRGYGQFANLGLPGVGNAFNLGKNLIDMQLVGGTGFQRQDQLGIDEDVARWNFGQQAPYNQYADIFNIMNATVPGGSGVYQPSAFDRALQGGMLGMGLYNMFNPQDNPLAATPQAQGTLNMPGPGGAPSGWYTTADTSDPFAGLWG